MGERRKLVIQTLRERREEEEKEKRSKHILPDSSSSEEEEETEELEEQQDNNNNDGGMVEEEENQKEEELEEEEGESLEDLLRDIAPSYISTYSAFKSLLWSYPPPFCLHDIVSDYSKFLISILFYLHSIITSRLKPVFKKHPWSFVSPLPPSMDLGSGEVEERKLLSVEVVDGEMGEEEGRLEEFRERMEEERETIVSSHNRSSSFMERYPIPVGWVDKWRDFMSLLDGQFDPDYPPIPPPPLSFKPILQQRDHDDIANDRTEEKEEEENSSEEKEEAEEEELWQVKDGITKSMVSQLFDHQLSIRIN